MMNGYEASNLNRQRGFLSYFDENHVITLDSKDTKIKPEVYSQLRRECRYIIPTKESLLVFCNSATQLTMCTGIYTVGTRIHLDGQWFNGKEALCAYLSTHEIIPASDCKDVIELLRTELSDEDLALKFEQLTDCGLIIKDGKYTCAGHTFNGKESMAQYFNQHIPVDFTVLADSVNISASVQEGKAIVLDDIAYIASDKNTYDENKTQYPLRGVVGKDGTINWLSVDKSKFQKLKTDRGDCQILNTLYKKSVRTLYTKVLPIDVGVKTRPYPIGILPNGEYVFSFRGKDGDSIDKGGS